MTQTEAVQEGVKRGWHYPWAEVVPYRDEDWRTGTIYRVGSQYILRGESDTSYEAAFADVDKREKGGPVMTDPNLQYTISDARYAKNMIAIQIPGIDGWKSLAAMILTTKIAPRARWSDRENAYIVSKPQAARFVYAIEEIRSKRESVA